jgi:hypothetical protein
MTEQNLILAKTIRTIGWSAIAISAIAIISEGLGFVLYNPLQQIDVILRLIPKESQKNLNDPIVVIRFMRIWSLYTIIYFLVVLAGAIKFVRFRSPGRVVLEYAAWIGVMNGFLDSYLNYAFWKSFQTILSSAMESANMPLGKISPFGILSIAGSFALWIVPSILLIVYLRKPAVKAFIANPKDNSGTT